VTGKEKYTQDPGALRRTALRDPNWKKVIHAIVPDELSANRLAGLIGMSEVSQLGSLYTKPRKPLTPTQKSRNHEAKKARDAPDIQMPGDMNGMALSHYVRKRWPPTIVAISLGNRPSRDEMPSGSDFLAKPGGERELSGISRRGTQTVRNLIA
jgi:hypothetical protein